MKINLYYKAVSELATLATATARSARLSVLRNSRRARPSRSCSRSRHFGHGLSTQAAEVPCWLTNVQAFLTSTLQDRSSRKCRLYKYGTLHSRTKKRKKREKMFFSRRTSHKAGQVRVRELFCFKPSTCTCYILLYLLASVPAEVTLISFI